MFLIVSFVGLMIRKTTKCLHCDTCNCMETDWIHTSSVFNQGQHQQVPSNVKFMNKEGNWEGREAGMQYT